MTHAAYPVEVAGMANIAARGIRPGEGGQRDPSVAEGCPSTPAAGAIPQGQQASRRRTDDAAPARAWTSIVTPLPVRSDCVPPDSHYERYSDSNHYPNEGVTDHGRDADQPADRETAPPLVPRSGEPPRGPNDRHWSGAIRTLPPRPTDSASAIAGECRPGRTSCPVTSRARLAGPAPRSRRSAAGSPGGRAGKKPAVFSRSSQ